MTTRKKTDDRSSLDLEICAAEAAVERGEETVRVCKEAALEMAAHTSKLKTLDQELVPKENELKLVHERFLRMLENCSVLSTRKAKGGLSGHLVAALEAAAQQGLSELNPQISTTKQTIGQVGSRSGVNAASTHSRVKGEFGPINTSQGGPTSAPVESEKVLQKQLGAASRDLMTGMLTPLFNLPRTQAEEHNIAVMAAKAQERIATLSAALEKAPPQNNIFTEIVSVANNSGTIGSKQNKITSKSKISASLTPLANQPLKIEYALYCPPGLDPQIHGEVLKLREQRLCAEERVSETISEIKRSRETLLRIKEEGYGTKAALKSAEKELKVLTKAVSALYLKKEEQDIMKRKGEETAVSRKRDDKRPVSEDRKS